MARVLCDRWTPYEQARAALALVDVALETAAAPWSGDDVVGLISWEPVTVADLGRLPALRVISTPSVGFEHIDVEAATQRGIWVCHVPDYCVDEVADHALALLLALVRGIVELDRSVGEGDWDAKAAGPLRRLGDVRLGVVGFGRIGRALAARALGLGLDVQATDPVVPDETIGAAGVRPATLDELLRTSDAVSLHTPLTGDTDGLIGARELALLPRGAYLVNVARGSLVDETAMLAALESGQLAGAALDTLGVEPPTQAPRAPRLIVTPHAAWYSQEAEAAAHRRAAESVRAALEGSRPLDAVNEVVQ
ncbi:MAG: C-terminal binding protein [Gaiellaceae bacterium]